MMGLLDDDDAIQCPACPDGFYTVTTRYLCASFVVENGKVARCAPILRKNISYWMTIAKRISS